MTSNERNTPQRQRASQLDQSQNVYLYIVQNRIIDEDQQLKPENQRKGNWQLIQQTTSSNRIQEAFRCNSQTSLMQSHPIVKSPVSERT